LRDRIEHAFTGNAKRFEPFLSATKTMEDHVGTEPADKVDEIDDIDFDIDFAVNEPERPMTLGKYGGHVDDISFNDMDLTDSHAYPKDDDEVSDTSEANTADSANLVEESTSSLSDIKQDSSLVPLPEQVQRQRSASRAIPSPTKVIPTNHHPSIGSQPSSAGSTGSAFLNNILNPGSAFNNAHLSHTPPTHVSTSYEVSHFGKRARSGVSTV
jgi:hypothetical protein